ncbi:hypothetical protein C8R43DRAFT_638363 [Mycena crocata]|nr:hypothetical protein C8R43DRAFT_638363 [Mycena crocata]
MTGRSLPLLCGPMPSLRHLNVLAMADFPSVTLGDAPLLRYVRIVGHPAVFILPWRQLTFLVLEFVFRDECATVLQQTAVLVHCELSFSYSNFDEDQLPKIELPLLQSLILLKEDPEPTPYLHNLVLPALRTLQIVEVDLGYDPIFELSSFLSKSRCALRELHMHITGDQAVKAAAYRTAFPTIPELLFTHGYGGAEQSDSDSEE